MPKKNIFSLQKTSVKHIVSALLLALLLVGGLVALYLSQQGQDLRQQAMSVPYSPVNEVLCCINGVTYNRFRNEKACGQAMGEVVKSSSECKKTTASPPPSKYVMCCINGVSYSNKFETDKACGQAGGKVVATKDQCGNVAPAETCSGTGLTIRCASSYCQNDRCVPLYSKKGGVKCFSSKECESGQCTMFKRCAYSRGE